MVDQLKPIAEQHVFNGTLFNFAFENVSREESLMSPVQEQGSSLHWIAAHLVTARYHILHLLRKPLPLPWDGRYEQAVSPELQQSVASERIMDEWERVTPILLSALATADLKLLHTAPPSPFPTIEQNTLAAIAFMANHEAYHIGQLSYLRAALGKTPLIERLLETS